MNPYVASLKKALDDYAQSVTKENAWIKKALDIYQPEYAAKEVDASKANIRTATAKARQTVESIMQAELEKNSSWGTLKGENVDAGDLALLQGGFNLSGRDLDALVQKHRNNATMLNAIESYMTKRQENQSREDFVMDALSVPAVPTLANREKAIRNFARKATGLIDAIDEKPDSITQYKDTENLTDATSMDMLLAGFGSPGLSNKQDSYVLGE
jgi:hypothetical protein